MLAVALGSIAAGTAAAATFYVDNTNPGCSNAAGSGTLTTPYCTIGAAVSQHRGPDNTIVVLAGIYREQVSIPASGAPGLPFVIRAASQAVVVDGADDFSSPAQWTLVSGNVWLAAGVTWAPKQVFADGARLTPSTNPPATMPSRTFQYVAGTGVYVNAGGGNPASHGTVVGRRLFGFTMFGRSWINIEGFTVRHAEDKGIQLQGASNNCVVVDNRTVRNFKFGIQLIGSSFGLVARNLSTENGGHGIALTAGSTGCTVEDNESANNADPAIRQANGLHLFGAPANVIRRNRFHHNQDSGEQINGGSNNCISVQNFSWSNGDHGADHLNSTGTLHVNEVIWGNFKDGFSVEGNATGTQIFNSIAVDNGTTTNEFDLFVDELSTAGFVSDYNIFWNSTTQPPVKFAGVTYPLVATYAAAIGQDTHSLQSDPRFANAAAGDFHLTAGSPAIDAANSGVANWPATDAEGRARFDVPTIPNTGAGPVAFSDRGALEFVSVGPPVVVAPASVTVAENALLTLVVRASDPDGEPITSLNANLSGLPPGNNAVFRPDPGNTSGTLTWRPTFSNAGTYSVTFTASNALSGSATTVITVTNVDRAPVVVAPSSVHVRAGSQIVVGVTASDPDGDPIQSLTADLSRLPAGHTAVFTRNGTNTAGQLVWTPRSGDKGNNSVYFTATNALSKTEKTKIHVKKAEHLAGPAESDDIAVEAVETLALSAAYPQPTRGTVSLNLDLPDESDVEWAVYDVAGREIWSDRGAYPAGHRTLSWDGRTRVGVPAGAGLYLVRVRTAGQSFTRRVVRW